MCQTLLDSTSIASEETTTTYETTTTDFTTSVTDATVRVSTMNSVIGQADLKFTTSLDSNDDHNNSTDMVGNQPARVSK